MKEKIIAAIDIGTNSFHLVISKIYKNGTFKVLTRDKEVVRLGNSSKDMKYLSAEKIECGISALRRFKMVCDAFKAGEIRAVATSATREAINKKVFIDKVLEETGIKIEVVSGIEEARLIYLGVLQALPVYNKKILLIDIGGGSTEFLIGEKGDVLYANTAKVGAVRVTERFFSERKIKNSLINECRLYVKSLINPVVRVIKKYNFEEAVGTSGTILTLGTMILSDSSSEINPDFSVNNYSFSKDAFHSITKMLFKCESVSEIKEIKGVESERADILVAGAIILEQIFNEFNLKEITISGTALREGIVLDFIDKESNSMLSQKLSNVRYHNIIKLAENCVYEKEHSNKVLDISLKIFDFIANRYNLTEKEKEYLEAAAILHDVGHSISHSQHHRHSYYLIRNSELFGFNDTEIEIIANIARYHRKSHPKSKHEWYMKLDDYGKNTVRKLAGILRVADGLDRGHNSIVENLEISLKGKNLNINLITKNGRSPMLEIWGANMRKELFEEEYGLKMIINSN
jgi:exopolyphosphatase/guanosine-5'-triphosphate,3'-diphosphate pyrophosphatase